jgi:ABC-type microcin C transport system permease subunit YejB
MFEKIINWAFRYKIKKMKHRWFSLLKKYYDFEVWKHLIIIIAVGLMCIGWGTVCEMFGLSNTLYESILSIPLGIVILASTFCLLMKIVRKVAT